MQRATALIPGIAVGKHDHAIFQAWMRATGQLPKTGGEFCVGIANRAGKVYRGCTLIGLETAMDFIEAVKLLGFTCEKISKQPGEDRFGFHYVLSPVAGDESNAARDQRDRANLA